MPIAGPRPAGMRRAPRSSEPKTAAPAGVGKPFGRQLRRERSKGQRPIGVEAGEDRRQRLRMGLGLRCVSLAGASGVFGGSGTATKAAELDAAGA